MAPQPASETQGLEFWRFVTFQFLHANWLHLFFNMLALWIFGPLVEAHMGFKRYAAFYLMCGIAGALMYLALNLAAILIGPAANIPGLLSNDPRVSLVGASAGVFGVLMAAAGATQFYPVDPSGIAVGRASTCLPSSSRQSPKVEVAVGRLCRRQHSALRQQPAASHVLGRPVDGVGTDQSAAAEIEHRECC